MGEKLKLYGFNNLTKALSFNIYDVCYAKTPREQRDYISYIDEQYNSERLTNILTTLTDMIGAQVLNIARQDYDPQGASVTILIAEGSMIPVGETPAGPPGQEPCDGAHLPGISSGNLPCHLPGGHRRGHLRGHHPAVHPGLPDRLV